MSTSVATPTHDEHQPDAKPMIATRLFLAIVFVCSAAIVWLAITRWMQRPLQQRLQNLREQAREPQPRDAPFRLPRHALPDWLRQVATRIAALALPTLPDAPAGRPWEAFALRWRFLMAGLRTPQAPLLHFALKALLTFMLPAALLMWVALRGSDAGPITLIALALLLAAAGYWLPDAWLRWRTAHRQRALVEAFPDALDLMLVCVEAGLGLDAAIDRVSRDIALQSPELADELGLLALELRTGASRAEALRHLALRVGLEEIDTLVSTLIQADRFGTRVSDALRVHAAALRTRRRLLAEEAAGKLPVKLLLPLVLFIFPGLLVVLMGPPAIRALRVLMPIIGASGT